MNTVPKVPPIDARAANLPCSDLQAHLSVWNKNRKIETIETVI